MTIQQEYDKRHIRFMTRLCSLPLAQDSLSTTQSIVSQFGLGRALLDQAHHLIQRFTQAVHHTQDTRIYQHYIGDNHTLQRTLIKMDGWACALLDKVPLIQQPTATIVDTLIVQPRSCVVSALHQATPHRLKQRCTNWTSRNVTDP
ncbi:hypothetical protein BC941DRAFT_424885 [Chlamydoabsidia padenii]|nr:hypothetical protein BC941DRAFT_424885 [Chlamydoabsidia padenii]